MPVNCLLVRVEQRFKGAVFVLYTLSKVWSYHHPLVAGMGQLPDDPTRGLYLVIPGPPPTTKTLPDGLAAGLPELLVPEVVDDNIPVTVRQEQDFRCEGYKWMCLVSSQSLVTNHG